MAQTTKGSDSGLNSIDVAVSAHNKIFGWYIVVLTGTVVFSYFVWRSGNRVQEAVRDDALARISEARKEAAAANEHAASLALETAHLHKENLELEAALSPRYIKDQGAMAKALSAFAETSAMIEYLPDAECQRMAGQINAALQMAGWNVLSVNARSNEPVLLLEGVWVQCGWGDKNPDAPKLAEEAIDTLISELNKFSIHTKSRAGDIGVSPGIVIIRIGVKPNPYANKLRDAGAVRGNISLPVK